MSWWLPARPSRRRRPVRRAGTICRPTPRCGAAAGPGAARDHDEASGMTGEGRGQGQGHSHSHGTPMTATGRHRRALVTVLALSALIAVAEVVGPLVTGALVLLADAAHLAADVSGIALSLLAPRFRPLP